MFSFKLASRANQKKKEKDVGAEFVIMNFLVKVVKKNMRPFKVWLGPLLFIKILFKIAQLFSKHFPPCLSFYFFYFFFQGYVYNSPAEPSSSCIFFTIFFCFHKCFNNLHLRKNSLQTTFFTTVTETCVSSYFYFHDSFSLKQNNLMSWRTKRFLFILTDDHINLRYYFQCDKKMSIHTCAIRDNIM